MALDVKNVMTIAFALPPEKAIEYLKSKLGNIIPDSKWDEWVKQMGESAYKDAFTIANVAKADVLQLVLDEITKAQESGKDVEEFKKSALERLQTSGWTGSVKPSRLTTVYNTNVQIAYANGQYESLNKLAEDTDMKYWQFRQTKRHTANEGHKVFDGLVFAQSDPIWKYIFPPCHYNCNCYVVALSDADLQKNNLEVSDGKDYLSYIAKNKQYFQIRSTYSFKPDTSKYDPNLKKQVDKDIQNAV